MAGSLASAPARAAEEPGDEAGRGGRRHKLRKGRHAHHEGARRRWREELTAREHKRYEAVWASNRGWLLGRDGAERVANVAVRELWRRCRLPEDELAEVWDLVDRGKQGALSRAEFVGMWFIDQRLRGRKVPPKVSDSLWGSAQGLTVTGLRARQP